MKFSHFELDRRCEPYTNNWLKLHGYALVRWCGKRKRLTKRIYKLSKNLPFK